MLEFLCNMVENEHFKVGRFILKTNSSPAFSIVNNRHVTRMEFLFLLLFVYFLHTPVGDVWRPGLNLDFSDRSLEFLRFIRAYEDAKSIKVVNVTIIVRVFWLLRNWFEVIHCETISIEPIFSFKFVSCHLEINSCNPREYVCVRNNIRDVATWSGDFGGEHSFIFKKNRVSMRLPFAEILSNCRES